jgi:putative transcriptional regulator
MTNENGKKVVDRLKRFSDALEANENVADRFTCKTIKLNLEPQTYSADLVKKTRQILGASQAIFAQFLGASASAVQDWEQGRKPPSNIACRIMDEIRRDPAYWVNRLQELSINNSDREAIC